MVFLHVVFLEMHQLVSQIAAVIKFDIKRSFLMLDIEIILFFGIPDKCACAKIKLIREIRFLLVPKEQCTNVKHVTKS